MMAACLAAGAGAVASHRAAAFLYDLPVAGHLVELTISKSRRIRTHGVIIHRTGNDCATDRRVIQRIPVTSPARTIIDLSTILDLPQLEAVLDEALSRKNVRPQHVLRRLQSLGGGGRKGTRSLRFLLEERLAASLPHESQFEAALDRVLRRNKLPSPSPQFRVRLPSGRTARLDFAYPEVGLAVEADSYRYHSSLTAWSRDRARNNELIAMGWRVLPVTFAELRDDPESVAEQIARCLRSGPGVER
jgi:very-short-patch-repair endonuclease